MLTRAGFELAPLVKLASNPCGLDSSTGRAADRYPEDASSNPARVNIFQQTSAVSDGFEIKSKYPHHTFVLLLGLYLVLFTRCSFSDYVLSYISLLVTASISSAKATVEVMLRKPYYLIKP